MNDDENVYKDNQDNETNNEDKDQNDSMKLEKLVYGYQRAKPYIVKQNTSDWSQNNDQVETSEPTRIQFGYNRKDSESSKSAQSYKSSETFKRKQVEPEPVQDSPVPYLDPCERTLHKIVSNTLKFYQFDESYSPDTVMNIFSKYDLMKYSSLSTNDSDPRMLNSIIDLGEYPMAKFYTPPKHAVSVTYINKRNEEFDDLESTPAPSPDKNKPKQLRSTPTFLPPRPNKYLDVLTYSEWSPNFEIRDDQILPETLDLTNADR